MYKGEWLDSCLVSWIGSFVVFTCRRKSKGCPKKVLHCPKTRLKVFFGPIITYFSNICIINFRALFFGGGLFFRHPLYHQRTVCRHACYRVRKQYGETRKFALKFCTKRPRDSNQRKKSWERVAERFVGLRGGGLWSRKSE